jgi:hypothetical protein
MGLINWNKKQETGGPDRSHGSPWDRGGADAYYWRDPNPHKWPNGDHRQPDEDLTPDEVEEYLAGYRAVYDSGDRKDWGGDVPAFCFGAKK